MKIPHCMAGLLLALGLVAGAAAQTTPGSAFPSKPIRLVVPYPTGGVVDGLARVLANGLKDEFGQTVLVENRPGGSGVIGMQACAKAPADGHTLCITVQDSLSYNPHLFSSLPYDAETDFSPVTNLGWTTGLLVVNSQAGINNYAEMVAAAKARPGKLNWGTWGEASQPDIQFRAVTTHEGIQIVSIPYKGLAQAVPAMLSGEVDITYIGVGNARQYLDTGRIKALALTGRQRLAAFPGLPTLAELGADPGLPTYMAAFAPAGVPRDVLNRLHAAFVKAAQTPAAQQFYRTFTLSFVGDRPSEFAEFVKADRATAGRVFQKMGFRRTEPQP